MWQHNDTFFISVAQPLNAITRGQTLKTNLFQLSTNVKCLEKRSPPFQTPHLGVSILKVESDDKFERIGGTATGGGTFWGLGKLLTKAKDFDDLLELAAAGDHRNVDMLVRDIYGEKDNYQTLGSVVYR